MQQYKVAVTDLDGTLLNEHHRLSSYTKQAAEKLKKANVTLGIATGRHYVDARGIRDILGIDAFLVTSNGAMVHDENDNLIVSNLIGEEISKDILLNLNLANDIRVNLYTEEKWLVDHVDVTLEKYHQDSGFSFELVDIRNLDDYKFIKLYFTCFDLEKLDKLEAYINQKYSDQVSTTYAMPFCLEIMRKGVNKAAALQQILELKGFAMQDTVAFGDGLNDYEMLSSVGKGYVMSNASEKLKELLPNNEVIGHHTDNVVTKFLENEFVGVCCQ